jgi:hypothetical protein
MLKFFSIFHLNLAYSSVEEEQLPQIIQKCYWPLLKLIEELNAPIGIEASGYTLERIRAISPGWMTKLKSLLRSYRCEFIGSGYAQIIGPLVPAGINDWNQKLGREAYRKYLNVNPEVAFVNEMAYSQGVLDHYSRNGYKAVIMEWNNPRRYHPEWKNEWRYFPQRALGSDAISMPVIWADSIAFQKFQRYAHGETDLKEYMTYLKSHARRGERFFPLYSNDAEIFNYRPNRYKTEPIENNGDEWKRIKELFVSLRQDRAFMAVKPSDVLKGLYGPKGNHPLRLESAEQPVPVKKQEKYNINRWALSGHDDLSINTKCYQIYHAMKRKNVADPNDWKELCFLWASDFRTHITSQRWKGYLKRLDRFHNNWTASEKELPQKRKVRPLIATYKTESFQYHEDKRNITVETNTMKCIFNKRKGLAIDKFWAKDISASPLWGTLSHGYYDDIALGADFYSGHLIIEKPGEHKITDLRQCLPQSSLRVGKVIAIRGETNHEGLHMEKEYRIPVDSPCLEIRAKIRIKRELATVHPMHFTIIPTSFDRGSLSFATHNGGNSLETFKIGGNVIHHAQSFSSLVSAKQGLGATEGIVMIGDKKNRLVFWHDQGKSAMIPSIHYLPVGESQYFLRLQYSAQELDETFIESKKSLWVEFFWKIMATNSE